VFPQKSNPTGKALSDEAVRVIQFGVFWIFLDNLSSELEILYGGEDLAV
jgi:hypothetical protein